MLPQALLAQTFSATLTRSQIRWEFLHVAVGVVLLVSGWAAVALFLFRRKTRDLTLVYVGLFSILYATRLLSLQGIVHFLLDVSPRFWGYVDWLITCTIVLPFGLFLYQLAGDRLRKLFRWLLAIQAIFAVLGIFAPFAGVSFGKLHAVNSVLVLVTFITPVVFLVVARRRADPAKPLPGEVRVLIAGFSICVFFVLHSNLRLLHLLPGPDVEFLGFLVFVGSLGYVAAHRTFVNEERLLAIHKELEIARQIQTSILPRGVPHIAGLDIAARHLPMSAVAGDFYDFLVVDEKRIGVLIADVTGHGVPAALIASMLKVAFAAQSAHADAPARVLSGLNRALCGKFEDHFVTGAYIFIDTEAEVMRYAGAGHPPLMVISRATGKARQIEENGLMLGLFPEADYTAIEIPISAGDRYLLCTDGVLEATNASKVEFGRSGSMKFLESNTALPAKPFSDKLVDEISRWSGHLGGGAQEDDITLLVVDFQASWQAAG